MTILVTGATGRVGRKTLEALRREKFPVHPLGFRHCNQKIESLDLRDVEATAGVIRRVAPSVIIHLAGNRNVVACENEKDRMHRINFTAAEHLCRMGNKAGAKMIFISSDYVFDGHSGPFDEDAPTNPQTQYGQDKLAIEKLIRTLGGRHAILRTSGIFGIDDDLVGVVLQTLDAGHSFTAFANLYNTPTYVDDFNQMLIKVLSDDIEGTLHCTGRETVSRHGFALQIADVFGRDAKQVKAQALDFTQDLRPPSLAMEAQRTQSRLGYQPRSIRQALRHIRDATGRSFSSSPA